MVSYIKGELTEILEDTIVLETNGIGYNIRVPASVLSQIPPVGKMMKIYTYLHVKEDAINLFELDQKGRWQFCLRLRRTICVLQYYLKMSKRFPQRRELVQRQQSG